MSSERSPAVSTRAPETAAATKSIAMKSRPLPRNTVAKKRSSASPTRSRTTPMNHRNAIPANGTSASATTHRLPPRTVGQPRPRLARVGGHRQADQHQGHPEQDREQNPRNSSGLGRSRAPRASPWLARVAGTPVTDPPLAKPPASLGRHPTVAARVVPAMRRRTYATSTSNHITHRGLHDQVDSEHDEQRGEDPSLYCRAIATRSSSSGSILWSASAAAAPTSISTQLTSPVNVFGTG